MAAEHPGALAHHFDSLEQQHDAARLGMWAFLLTEVMLFGAILTGYTVYRSSFPAEFEAGSGRLIVGLGALNTAILLGSSLTMALAVQAAQRGSRNGIIGFMLLTVLLGLVFLGIKATEYAIDYRESLVPGFRFDKSQWTQPGRVQMFFVFYFVLTGLHAVHMLIGIGVLLIVAFRARTGRYGPDYYTPVEMAGLYWHFVDIVWIFLFPLLYLVGTRELF